MAQLLMRASTLDAALLRRIYGLDGHQAAAAQPNRIVVDAHVPVSSRGGDIVSAARRAGVPLLIDPQTFYLQGSQHNDDPWALLPYGRPDKLSASHVDPFVQDELIAQVINYQVSHGATAIIPPYVHLDRLNRSAGASLTRSRDPLRWPLPSQRYPCWRRGKLRWRHQKPTKVFMPRTG
jgi:hypothetical protein